MATKRKKLEFWVFDDVLEGLTIIQRYCKKERSVQVDTDLLWAGSEEAKPEVMRDTDFERMGDLGWYWLGKRQCWAINL